MHRQHLVKSLHHRSAYPGNLYLWVKPVSADKPGIRKAFSFGLVNREGFDTIRYYFEIASTSESVIRTAVNTDHSHFLPIFTCSPPTIPVTAWMTEPAILDRGRYFLQ